MAEKRMASRVQLKHDVEANWVLATNFTPKEGEVIIYDIDSTHDQPRIKIGDGSTNVNTLPFAVDEVALSDEMAPITNEEIDAICSVTTVSADEVVY